IKAMRSRDEEQQAEIEKSGKELEKRVVAELDARVDAARIDGVQSIAPTVRELQAKFKTQVEDRLKNVADDLAAIKTDTKAYANSARSVGEDAVRQIKTEQEAALAGLKKLLLGEIDRRTAVSAPAASVNEISQAQDEIRRQLDTRSQALSQEIAVVKSEAERQVAAAGNAVEDRLKAEHIRLLDRTKKSLDAKIDQLSTTLEVVKSAGLSTDDFQKMEAEFDARMKALEGDLKAAAQKATADKSTEQSNERKFGQEIEERLRAEQIRKIGELKESLLRQFNKQSASAQNVQGVEDLRRTQEEAKAQLEDRIQSLTNALTAIKTEAEKQSVVVQSVGQVEERLKADQGRKIAELGEKFSHQIKERIEAEARLQHTINAKINSLTGSGPADSEAVAELDGRVQSLIREIAAVKAQPNASMSDVHDARRDIETKLRSDQVRRFAETREDFTRLVNERADTIEAQLVEQIELKLANASTAAESVAIEAGKTVEAQGAKLRDRIIGAESRAAASEHAAKDIASSVSEIAERIDNIEWALDKLSRQPAMGGLGFRRLTRRAAAGLAAASLVVGIFLYKPAPSEIWTSLSGPAEAASSSFDDQLVFLNTANQLDLSGGLPATVNSEVADLRAAPSTDENVVLQVLRGTEVAVYEVVGDWARIGLGDSDNRDKWVHRNLLAVN
ncbi:MAG: SH3 domain-containing protein, partial [Alphaproteobacteria bacterium]|nr:SH3 domain-containing protein [Alphaproteobacteria bacterium]